MNTKTLGVVLFLFFMHLAEACIDCGCYPLTLPYFDYQGITVKIPGKIDEDIWNMTLRIDSVYYVAEASPARAFGWNTAAWGCSCESNGDYGAKYPVEKLHIFADQDFSDLLPAGAELNRFFRIITSYASIPADDSARVKTQGLFFSYWPDSVQIQGTAKPLNLNTPYHFRIELIKSNGDTLKAISDVVVFN